MNLKTGQPNRNVNVADGACDNEWLLIDIQVDFSIQRCQNLTIKIRLRATIYLTLHPSNCWGTNFWWMRKIYWLKAASRFSISFCRLTFWVIVFIMIHRHAVEGRAKLSVVIHSCLNVVWDFPIICVLMTNRLIWITNFYSNIFWTSNPLLGWRHCHAKRETLRSN
jgi:hypothetical protein